MLTTHIKNSTRKQKNIYQYRRNIIDMRHGEICSLFCNKFSFATWKLKKTIQKQKYNYIQSEQVELTLSTLMIYFVKVKLTFEMLTVHGRQHSFSTHEQMFLWKFQSFWDRKCLDLRGTRTPYHRIRAECSKHWAIRARHLLCHVFEYSDIDILK